MNELQQPIVTERAWTAVPRALALGASLLMLTACASTPPAPTQEINAAEQLLLDAEQAKIAEYALPELQEARAKINAAREAVHQEEMLRAKRLAEQAALDIQLGMAKTELAKAEEVNDDMKKNINVLKQEMDRNTGGQL